MEIDAPAARTPECTMRNLEVVRSSLRRGFRPLGGAEGPRITRNVISPGNSLMSRRIEGLLWETLVSARVKRYYGIVGDAMNAVVDALRRNGNV